MEKPFPAPSAEQVQEDPQFWIEPHPAGSGGVMWSVKDASGTWRHHHAPALSVLQLLHLLSGCCALPVEIPKPAPGETVQ